MENATKYEYRVWCVDDDIGMADKAMAKWAEAGWELVSGSATNWVESEGVGPQQVQMSHTRFVMYWRKPITTDAQDA